MNTRNILATCTGICILAVCCAALHIVGRKGRIWWTAWWMLINNMTNYGGYTQWTLVGWILLRYKYRTDIMIVYCRFDDDDGCVEWLVGGIDRGCVFCYFLFCATKL